MNRIARRAISMLLIAAVLLGGMIFFLVEYMLHGEQWALHPGSPHVYNGTNIGCGTVVDRTGALLLQMGEERTYAQDATLRRATLHWLGDRNGSIYAPVLPNYASELAGYHPLTGLYSYDATGGTATLTLSARVQMAALEAMGDCKGTVGVYNYKTGELLCAVTTPTYDPDNVPDIDGDTTGAYDGAYMNRFLQSVYIPGSVFKLVPAAAAVETIPDILEQTFVCTGACSVGGQDVTCEAPHGEQTLEDALLHSCNCAFANIAAQLGAGTLEAYVQRFCLTQPVRFDGATSAAGHYDLTGADLNQVAWSAVGQYTDQINPCRFLVFLGAIANGGTAAMPHVVQSVRNGGHLRYTARTAYTEQLMPEQTARLLQQFMQNNVVNGYGADNFPGLTVCAKTGTSQLGGDKQPNAIFAGFTLDEAYPLAFVVVAEESGYGGSVAMPIAAKVLAACKAAMDGA